MKKSQTTLINLFIVLNLISFNIYAEDFSASVRACNDALEQSNTQLAIQHADKVLKQDAKQQEALLCKGRALNAQGKETEAEALLNQAASQAQPGFDTTIANLILGNVYQSHHKTALALACYEKSLKSSEQEKNQKFTRISHNLMGETYSLDKNYNAALSSYLAGTKLANNDNERADSYERVASTYHVLNQLDSAIEYQVKAVMMQKISGTLDQYAEASLLLGQFFTQNKDYPSAEKTYEKLLQFSQENGGEYYEAKTDLYFAQTKLAQADKSAATTYLQNAKKIAVKINASDLSAQIDQTQKTLQ